MNNTPETDMSERPTPETDDLAITCYIDSVIEGVFGFRAVPIDDCRKMERERDEAREDVRTLLDIKRKHEHDELVAAQENDQLKQERDELRERNKTLQEALLRVQTWGINSKNWSATHGDAMSQWIDDGCVGELPPPHGQWIYEKLEGAK